MRKMAKWFLKNNMRLNSAIQDSFFWDNNYSKRLL